MVHGQAIGIPFRRRKGEQAPPPPKEVAWNPGIGNSVTITQIPEYQNGFVFNGKTAYLENLNILAITDFTAIAKRVWANKDNPMNECFIPRQLIC